MLPLLKRLMRLEPCSSFLPLGMRPACLADCFGSVAFDLLLVEPKLLRLLPKALRCSALCAGLGPNDSLSRYFEFSSSDHALLEYGLIPDYWNWLCLLKSL